MKLATLIFLIVSQSGALESDLKKPTEKNCEKKLGKLDFLSPTVKFRVYDRKKMGEYVISYFEVHEYEKDKEGLQILKRKRRFSCMHGEGIDREPVLLK